MKNYISIIAILFLLLNLQKSPVMASDINIANITAVSIAPAIVDAGGKVKVTINTNETNITKISVFFVPQRISTDDIAIDLSSNGNGIFSGQAEIPGDASANTWHLSRVVVYTSDNSSKSFHYADLEKTYKNLSFSSNKESPTIYISAPLLSLPAVSKVEYKDIKVAWSPVNPCDYYVFTVIDLTTNKEIIRQTIFDTETMIFRSEIKLNHKYKIGVAAKRGLHKSSSTYKTITVSGGEITTFSDIPTGHWAKTAVENLIKKGSIRGYEDGNFKPDKNITRAEFVTMLIKALETTDTGLNSGFSDVTASHWAAKEIAKAKQLNYVDGYQAGTKTVFKPNENITRAEMVSIIINATKLSGGAKAVSFTDVEGHWAKNAIYVAAQRGLVKGKGADTFKPNDKATRAEACMVLNNALEKQKRG